MFHTTDDLRIEKLRPLIPPAILMEELPLVDDAADRVIRARGAVEDVMDGRDDRLLVVVGPCSIHDTDAALEYASRLAEQSERLADDLLVVMRVYFEKPRTTVGWKGLINDPFLDGSFQINTGLRKARKLLIDINALGLPAGTEFLDTITPQFLADAVTWGAIGARTTESQVHRELASGLSMPVGFKNATNGNVQIAIDAIRAASHPHHFLSVTKQGIHAIVATRGNERCHLILRGGSDGPNYDAEHVGQAAAALEKANVVPRVMIDCSHGNSQKNHANQPKVADDVARQVEGGDPSIFGLMIESHLVSGNQAYEASSAVYGQSITDACLSFDETVPVLERLAQAVRARRKAKG